MSKMKRRELNDVEAEEARLLRNAWAAYKTANPGATQTWLAAETGLGTQGAVGQYLRGVIPLNIEALISICRVIGVDPRQISPRLTDIVEGFLPTDLDHFRPLSSPQPFENMVVVDSKTHEWLNLRNNLGSDDIAEFTALIKARQERNLRLIEELENSLHPRKIMNEKLDNQNGQDKAKKQRSQSS